MEIETWSIDRIKPYYRNAKKHKVDWIARSIKEFKIDQPIVVDGDGVIIKGHGRLKAAKELGYTEFPVVVRRDLTPEQICAARIADNRSGEGGWDAELLGIEMKDLKFDLPDFDFEALGISDDWLTELGAPLEKETPIPDSNKSIDEDAMSNTEHECPKCGFKW